LHALAQEDRRALAVLADLVALGDARHDLRAGGVPEQKLVARAHAVAVLAVAGSEKAAAPGAAVLADAAQRLEDHRLLGEALLDRRQLAGLDQRRDLGRLVELLRPLR